MTDAFLPLLLFARLYLAISNVPRGKVRNAILDSVREKHFIGMTIFIAMQFISMSEYAEKLGVTISYSFKKKNN
jgi:hypothetical protein